MWFVFCNSFSGNVSTISSLLKSLITYVYGTVFLTCLITKAPSLQCGRTSSSQQYFYVSIFLLDQQYQI